MKAWRLAVGVPVIWGLAAAAPVLAAPRVDRILIEKAERRLSLLAGRQTLRVYRVALGPEPVGDKTCQGDGRTPEGIYRISGRNRQSAYHRSLRISYPDASDRAAARKAGCDPGGDIFIHGLPNGQDAIGAAHRLRDWTLGCIAVTSDEIRP